MGQGCTGYQDDFQFSLYTLLYCLSRMGTFFKKLKNKASIASTLLHILGKRWDMRDYDVLHLLPENVST